MPLCAIYHDIYCSKRITYLVYVNRLKEHIATYFVSSERLIIPVDKPSSVKVLKKGHDETYVLSHLKKTLQALNVHMTSQAIILV